MPKPYATAAERVLANIIQTESGCWEWQSEINNQGYGRVEFTGQKPRRVLAHRFSYEAFVGPIPDGLGLDHLCRNRPCVNPEHLEPVTQRENLRRSPIALSTINAARTHCAQGHPFDDLNTYVEQTPNGPKRRCRTCRTARHRSWRERRAFRAAGLDVAA